MRQSHPEWSRSAWILLLIVLVGAILRIYRLDAQSFWGDEALSSLIAASSVAEIWDNVFGSTNPEGYYLLLHFWRCVAGGTDLALRYPSALLGALGVVLTYQLGRNVRSKYVGLWAAGLATLSPFHVFYSQETRMYALLYCLACIVTLAYIQLWRGKGGGWWIVFIATSVAGLWTHFFAGFVIAALGVHFCLLRFRCTETGQLSRKCIGAGRACPSWLGFFIANGIIVLALGVYWSHLFHRFQIVDTDTWWRTPPSLGNLITLPLAFIIGPFLNGVWQTMAFGCGMFLAIIVGLQIARALWRQAPAAHWLLLLALLFLVPVTASYIISQLWKSIFGTRVLIIVAPALYLLIGWGAVHTRERRFNQFILFLLLPQMLFGLCNWFFDPFYSKPPVRDAVYLVQESEFSDAPVLHAIAESFMVFEHYAPELDNCLLSDPAQPRVGKRIDSTAVSSERFWLVVLPTYSQEFQLALRDDFDARFNRQRAWNEGGIQIYYYVRN